AALASAIALTVVEPVSNGIGSDAFAILWDGTRLHGLNASGRAPRAWRRDRFAHLSSMSTTGWDAVTVPGAVSAWVALSERFGKLAFADLFEPAIEYARRGFLVSPVIAQKWKNQVPILRDVPGFAQAFMPHGRAPSPGERFSFPDQAETLERIAKTRGDAFYRGSLAEEMIAHCRECGGAMELDDLAAHTPEWVEPIHLDYRGYRVHELPPNGQGVAALIALGILEQFDFAAFAADSADCVHLQIEAMKLAFADVYAHVGDPSFMQMKCEDLLDRDYLRIRAALIDPKRAQNFGHGLPRRGGTVYLTAADAAGMMVSYIQSNYMGFGSGVVVPGTGISLQNRGSAFSLDPGHPNVIAGRKRPFHTIIPGFLSRDGAPVMSFGVMGATMQPQGHVQSLVRLIDYRQNPQAACDAPRWKVLEGLALELEHSFPAPVRAELASRGHRIANGAEAYFDFGAGQFIYKLDEGYLAASEPRRDGQAVGF
ncbi:MAG TPA: gamma-glutamyltransferase family protein, partial [Burkholderiales bacterium]|nr:gamma-glutamyltransferase family protein [Burkholderiales bacterium]